MIVLDTRTVMFAFSLATCLLLGSLAHIAPAVAETSGGGKEPNYTRETVSYRVPDVELIAHDGNSVSLVSAIGGEKPVMVNFVFTSCTTICPVLSASFAEVSRRLGEKGDSIEFVSISIDPEYDTQEKLAEYAKRMGAGARGRSRSPSPCLRAVLGCGREFRRRLRRPRTCGPCRFRRPCRI